ncbi:MAG: hypothetical protein ACJ8G1_17505 [Vitreoscilla sp.]
MSQNRPDSFWSHPATLTTLKMVGEIAIMVLGAYLGARAIRTKGEEDRRTQAHAWDLKHRQ